MNSNNIKVSVIVPVYNTEKYLNECLESIISQSLQEIEVICIDDGSTDGSYSILGKFAKRNKKVNILKQKNQGQSSARNAGLKIAKGKYICFVDSDDMLMPNALEEMFYLSESRELDMLLFDIVLWYENDVLRQCNNDDYYVKSCQYEGVKNGRELFCEMWGNREYDDVPWSRFVKKTLLEDNGITFYEGIIYEDNIYSLMCHMKAKSSCYVHEKYYIHRIREGSTMTRKISCYSVYSAVMVYEEVLKILYIEDLDTRTEKAVGEWLEATARKIKEIDVQLQKQCKVGYNITWSNTIANVLAAGMGIGNKITFREKMDKKMDYDWIYEKLERYMSRTKKIAILPMGKWGNVCRKVLQDMGVKDILCLDNYNYDNNTVFPLDRKENWDEDTLYIITAQNIEVCQDIQGQLEQYIDHAKIGKLFFYDNVFCETYGRVHLDFLFVGFQKCGTSSLQDALMCNSNIFLPKTKETFFVKNIHLPYAQKNFHQLYAGSSEKAIVGGIETGYLTAENASVVFKYFGSELKIMMLVRNPRDAVYSLFKMHMRNSSSAAIRYMNKYGKISPKVFAEWVESENYKNIYKYMDCVKEYLKYYKKENIKIIVFEDLVRDTSHSMDELQKYIGLKSSHRLQYDQMPHVNEGSKVPRDLASIYINQELVKLVYAQTDIELQTKINNLRGKISTITNEDYVEDMLKKTAAKLDIFYKDSIQELEDFMGRSMKKIWY